MDSSQTLEASAGYLDLGMPVEAWQELHRLEPEHRTSPEALAMRMDIHMAMEKWDDALRIANRLCRIQPQEAGNFLDAAHCLDMLGDTESALDALSSALDQHAKSGELHFHRARYFAVLGQTDAAKRSLKLAVRLDKSLRAMVRDEPDLETVRDAV